MLGRIIEINGANRHLAVSRGFMTVAANDTELGRVPLDDIAVVLANARGLTYTNRLLVELAGRGGVFVICAANHRPVAWLWPLSGHHAQGARLVQQAAAPKPLRKRLWRDIVVSKLGFQAAALEACGEEGGGVAGLARKVRVGDPDNLEAQGARRYWPLIFGSDFRRDRGAGGVNGLLNYGYTVLRAAMARAVVSAGLHPTLGLHHGNRTNDMALVDDLMEPFRPLVDLTVRGLVDGGVVEVEPVAKRQLAAVTVNDLVGERGVTPLMTALHRLAGSLAVAFEQGGGRLDLPTPPSLLELRRWMVFEPEAHTGGGAL
ncbi:MAG: type II CRISPR-associated endonuclease Cas1 [Alphaproteobacteria bacterium]|nr:MAG: type II CRISPR-associated endonuclease Cas1 [Alphaproteobacteria bacterium]